jgi:septum formation protein
MSQTPIVLASGSPRRKELLAGVGLEFEVLPSDVEEISLEGEAPQDQVCRLALEKATDVAAKRPGAWVLGADTIVVIDGLILGKPRDESEAHEMLARLSGRIHEVYTGYAIINSMFPEMKRLRFVNSKVFIRSLAEREIDDYISTGEPMDKAGSYAIQGIGAAVVQSVSGSYTNVVGLPLCEVAQDLKDLGVFDFLRANANHGR